MDFTNLRTPQKLVAKKAVKGGKKWEIKDLRVYCPGIAAAQGFIAARERKERQSPGELSSTLQGSQVFRFQRAAGPAFGWTFDLWMDCNSLNDVVKLLLGCFLQASGTFRDCGLPPKGGTPYPCWNDYRYFFWSRVFVLLRSFS
jgi:hypothetical protein